MKIKKTNKVKACNDPYSTLCQQANDTKIPNSAKLPENEPCPYEQAECYLKSAICALSSVAKDDPIAKESIANIAVILLDLQK